MARMTKSDIELYEAIAKRDAIAQPNYAHSRNLTGEPSEKNRVYRASDNCWKRGLRGRTFGVADENKPVAHTYRSITADGTVTVKSAKIRKQNIHTKTRNRKMITDTKGNQVIQANDKNRNLINSLPSNHC